jgi:hypothetical protein
MAGSKLFRGYGQVAGAHVAGVAELPGGAFPDSDGSVSAVIGLTEIRIILK